MASTAKKSQDRRAAPARMYAGHYASDSKTAIAVQAPAKVESPMYSALAQLNGDVNDLSMTVQVLISRLEVVSSPITPSDSGNGGESPHRCETVTQVLEQSVRVRNVAYALAEATARLEI